MNIEETELISRIQQAFTGVKLGDGYSLNMTEYNDSGGCAPRFAELAKGDECENWQAIPDSVLEQFTVTFSFTDIAGFRFYLPAYMIWTLKHHEDSDSIIGDHTIYAIDSKHYLFENQPITSVFTQAQMSCILDFLKYCISHDDTCDDTVAKQNLDKLLAEINREQD